MPIWPGDITLLRVLMHSMKALLSRILEWSLHLCSSPWGSSLLICDWRVKESEFGEDVLACSQGQLLGASSDRYLPCFIVFEKYFSTIRACLVGSISMVFTLMWRRTYVA